MYISSDYVGLSVGTEGASFVISSVCREAELIPTFACLSQNPWETLTQPLPLIPSYTPADLSNKPTRLPFFFCFLYLMNTIF